MSFLILFPRQPEHPGSLKVGIIPGLMFVLSSRFCTVLATMRRSVHESNAAAVSTWATCFSGRGLFPGDKCSGILQSLCGQEVDLLRIHCCHKYYKNLEISYKSKYKQVKFINIIASTLSVFDSSSVDFLEIIENLKFDQTCRHYSVKKMIVIAIRTPYYVFYRRNKDWDKPELMKF